MPLTAIPACSEWGDAAASLRPGWRDHGPGMTALGGQPIQHRKSARQNRRHGQGKLLPRHALALAHFKVTLPVVNLAPVQADQGMRIIVLRDLPGLCRTDHHAQLFFQFAAREAARPEALVWALERGSRSGRVAYQFARDFAGRAHG